MNAANPCLCGGGKGKESGTVLFPLRSESGRQCGGTTQELTEAHSSHRGGLDESEMSHFNIPLLGCLQLCRSGGKEFAQIKVQHIDRPKQQRVRVLSALS